MTLLLIIIENSIHAATFPKLDACTVVGLQLKPFAQVFCMVPGVAV